MKCTYAILNIYILLLNKVIHISATPCNYLHFCFHYLYINNANYRHHSNFEYIYIYTYKYIYIYIHIYIYIYRTKASTLMRCSLHIF